jgi:ubiquinone biosynthesis protein Coq4
MRDFGLGGPWSALQTLRNFAVTTWDPAKSDIRQGINRLIQGALRDPKPEAIAEARRRSPACAALFDESYDPPLDLDQLATLPPGTLGHEYARFVRENGIEPLGNQVEWGRAKNLLQYNMLRGYKLHDVMHVVLGCPATPLGEIPIVAFSVGQASRSESKTVNAPALALAVVLLHIALRRTHEFAEACHLTGEWTRIGERSRPYTEFRLEDMMDQRVADVRARVLVAA